MMRPFADDDPFELKFWFEGETFIGSYNDFKATASKYGQEATEFADGLGEKAFLRFAFPDRWPGFVLGVKGSPPSSETPTMEILIEVANQHGADGFFMSVNTKHMYRGRRRHTVHKTLATRPEPSTVFCLPVVSGPTGSGKTYFMIHSRRDIEIGVYLTAADLDTMDDGNIGQLFGPNGLEKKGGDYSINDRNDDACALLLAAVKRVLPRQAVEIMGIVKCFLFIVVDELGSAPKFLTAMCRAGPQMIDALQHHYKTKCELMAGGTGASGFAMQVGSLPGTYHLIHLPTGTREVWDSILTRITDEPARSVAQRLGKNSTARQLTTNPRMAAIMYDHLTRKNAEVSILGLQPRKRAIKSILPIFLARVASEFRGLTGMYGVDAQTMRDIHHSALKMIHFPEMLQPDPKVYPQEVGNLIVKYGVLVDRSHWEFEKPLNPGEQLLGFRTENQVCEELHSPIPRFVMPPAQAQLFRLGYGFRPEKPSGDGFEQTLLQWLETLLLGAHGGTLQDLLGKLGHPQVHAVPKTKLTFPGVATVESRVKIEPKSLAILKAEGTKKRTKEGVPKNAWARVKELTVARKAVIILNGPKAAFADLAVLIPGVAIILVQAKFYQQATGFSRLDVCEELWKMGYEGAIKTQLRHGAFAQTVEAKIVPDVFFELTRDELEAHLIQGQKCGCALCKRFSDSDPKTKTWTSLKLHEGYENHLANHDDEKCRCDLSTKYSLALREVRNFLACLRKSDVDPIYHAKTKTVDRQGLALYLDFVPQCKAWKAEAFAAYMAVTDAKHSGAVVKELQESLNLGEVPVFWSFISTKEFAAGFFLPDVMYLHTPETDGSYSLAPLEMPTHPTQHSAFKVVSDTDFS